MQHEWFVHLPYEAKPDSISEEMCSAVAFEGAAAVRLSHPKSFLYATQMRMIFTRLFLAIPERPVVGLLNYCRSGGALLFLDKNRAARRALGAQNWPLFLMASSSSHRPTDSDNKLLDWHWLWLVTDF